MLIVILEEALPRQILTSLDQAPVFVAQSDLMLLAAFAAKFKDDRVVVEMYMVILQGRQPIGIVVARIFIVADADQASAP